MPHIWELFRGYEKAHGRYDMRHVNERGKVEGKASTIREPATEALWQKHIAGDGAGLGIIALLQDDTVAWGCIDIDKNNIDHAALEARIKQLNIPLVVARSKSGGAHCYLFIKGDPAPAQQARQALESWAAALGYGGCEVFPKQSARYDEKDIGNWLNMPYYYAEKTLRYGFKDGVKLSLEEFEVHAAASAVEASTLDNNSNALAVEREQAAEGLFPEGPPCLQHLQAAGGFPEGTRNDGMYNVAVYLRKRFPDDWQDRMSTYNTLMCDTPIGLNEINALVKSVSKKGYGYRCKQPPIAPHCHRRLCLTRACGVGESTDNGAMLRNITKYDGDPVLWFADVEDKRLMFTSEELLSQSLFKRKIMEATKRVVASVPGPRWDKYLDEVIKHAEDAPTPEDASPTGQFALLLGQYLTGVAQATSKLELANRNTPYHDTALGKVYFRSRGLLEYLNTHSFKVKSEHHVWQMLREMGATTEKIFSKGVGASVWVLPEPSVPQEDAPAPKFGTTDF